MADFRAEAPLILLAQAGDRRALEQLLKAIQEPLYGYLDGLVGDPHLAEVLLQDVFVLLVREFRLPTASLSARQAFCTNPVPRRDKNGCPAPESPACQPR